MHVATLEVRCTVGAALWECHAVHDHGVLGRAVGTGPWGAEGVIFCTALSRIVDMTCGLLM